MRTDDALAILRSLPTAEARACAARPLLDCLQAPGSEPVAGWQRLFHLAHVLDPGLSMHTTAAIARNQESRLNGDAVREDLDSLAAESRLLHEPLRALCTPVRSPAAAGALVRLHLPPWVFGAADNCDDSFPPEGIRSGSCRHPPARD